MAPYKLISISFTSELIVAHFADKRIVGCPIDWFPRLAKASPEKRENYSIQYEGTEVSWPELNEDLSAEGFFTYSPTKASS